MTKSNLPVTREQLEQMNRNAQRILEMVRPMLENWPPPWLKDIQELIVFAQAQVEAFNKLMGPFWLLMAKVAQLHQLAERIEAAGWLPHYTTPFADLAELGAEEISTRLAAYYQTEWSAVSAAISDNIAEIDVDAEAKETIAEALRAHGRGDYRCAPRLLFPEIERVVRDEFYPGDLKQRLASQIELRDAAQRLPAGALSAELAAGLKMYDKLVNHLYAKVEDDAALAKATNDPVPNRHAALHGLVSYKTQQSSLNAIMMTEFALHLVGVLKRHLREKREADASA